MITARLSDRRGGVAAVLRDFNVAPYYPTATVGAARVEVWVRNKDRGVDAAVKVGEFRPGSDVDFNVGALSARDLLVATVSVSAGGVPSISDLNHAAWLELNFTPGTGTAAGIDEDVPVVTLAPTIAKADGLDEWVIFTPAPDAHGATVTDGQVRVVKADDVDVVEVWPVPVTPYTRIPQKPYASTVSYRWRNQSAEDAGSGRGWSAWSPGADAAEAGAAVQPPSVGGAGGVLETFEFDPADSRAGIERGVITA